MRAVSSLIPVQITDKEIKIYLQKRPETAKRIPGYFGFWGGGLEDNETFEQALVREVKEEMGIDINLSEVEIFHKYQFLKSPKTIFLLRVNDGWNHSINVGEGDPGKWITTEEALQEPKIILEDKVVINDLERVFLNKEIS